MRALYDAKEQRLAIDLCNGLIEEEFSAQDIMDVAEEFYFFVREFFWDRDEEEIQYPEYLTKTPFSTADDIYSSIRDIFHVCSKPTEENAKMIKEIVEDLREEIKLVARAILEEAKKDNLEYRKDLKEEGYSEEKIEKMADLDKVEPLPSIKITQYKYNDKFGYPRIGENKLKMIVEGRIIKDS